MAQQTINIGASPNDGTGTPLRTAFQYTNSNFSELYTAVGPSGNNIVVPGNATITGDLTVATDRLKVVTGSTAVQIGSTTQTQFGTTAWPTDLISKASSRVLIGNLGTTLLWNESSPAIGNASTLYIGAKTGAGATTFGGGYISAGTENASDRAGFFALSTFQSNGIDRERYRIDSTGIHTWQYVGGFAGTAMTLNSTGLGVGDAPAANTRLTLGSVNPTGLNLAFKTTGVTTGRVQTYLGNTSGDLLSGIEGSTAGQTLTGSAAYSGFIGTFTNNPFYLVSNGLIRATIDSSGNVGIGVTPSAWASNYKSVQTLLGAALSGKVDGLVLAQNCYYDGTNWVNNRASTYSARYDMNVAGNSVHAWYVYNGVFGSAGNTIPFVQAMTLDASGNLLVGTTADSFQPTKGIAANASNSSRISVGHANGTASGDYYHSFAYNGAVIGSITQSGTTGVAFNATSDYRLKEAVQPLVGGLARVSALKPSIYKWKADGSNGEGFLAHELAEVVPAAVSGEKDAVNEDGSIKPQGVDMSRVVPILVAAIQELAARVQTIETR